MRFRIEIGSDVFGEARSAKAWWLLLPAACVYLLAFFVPLAVILIYSLAKFDGGVTTFGLSLHNYREALFDGVTLPALALTAKLAVWITVTCALLGFPVSLMLRRASPGWKAVILGLVVTPLLTSIIVRNVAWLLVLGRGGLINDALLRLGIVDSPLRLMYNEVGVIIAVVHVYLPFMVLPIYASVSSIDVRIEECAASLGAKPLATFWWITFPLSAPGLIAGCTLTFVLSMGIYLTPVIMGGNFVVTLPMIITDLVRNQYDWPQASALAILLLATIGLAVSATSRLGGSRITS